MPKSTSGYTVLRRILTVAIALAIGGAIVVTFISNKQPPERIEVEELARNVRVVEATELSFMIEARGFGTSAPAQSWAAVSNVKGHVIFQHEELESGAMLPEGTLLLEIDPGFYELSLAEANADLAGIEAEVAQLNQEAVNADALLVLEQQRLDLAEIDLKRTQDLVEVNAVAQSQLDVQLRATLQQRQAVQTLVNQQNILPIQLARLDAQKERVLAKRLQIENDLSDTKIVAPFDMRIGEVNVDLHQYVNVGQMLFTGDGIETAEVSLQFSMNTLRRVLAEIPSDDGMDIEGLDAQVQLLGEDQNWDADVVRIANGIDPATRTVRVTLHVQQPEDTMDMLENPPLPKGAYVEGVISVASSEPLLVLPQEALHQGWVYIVDAEQRLLRQQVEVAFQQDGLVVIQSGVQSGDVVIIDDISPAISGSLLNPQRDQNTEQYIADKAAGEIK